MAGSDRWTFKILSLPIFDEAFAQAIMETPLRNLAFVSAMGVSSGSEFADKVAEWSGNFDRSVADVLLDRYPMLEQFWSLVSKAERVFLESTAFQLGFGQCEGFGSSADGSPVAKLRQAAVIKSLLNKPSAPKKTRTGVGPSPSNTPLLDAENAEQAKWAARLEAIGKRAGQHAKLFSNEETCAELSASESARLRQLVLISGAPRTMAAHIRAFERWECWADQHGTSLYPISIERFLKYCL